MNGYGTAGRPRGRRRRCPSHRSNCAGPPWWEEKNRKRPRATEGEAAHGSPATGGNGAAVLASRRVGNLAARGRGLRHQGSKAGGRGAPTWSGPAARALCDRGGVHNTRLGDRTWHLCVNLARTSFSADAGRRRAADRAGGSHTSLFVLYVALPFPGCGPPMRPAAVTAVAITAQVARGRLVPGLFRLHGWTNRLLIGTGAERLGGTSLDLNHCAGRCHLFRPRSVRDSPQATT